jgi:hypothetical protein
MTSESELIGFWLVSILVIIVESIRFASKLGVTLCVTLCVTLGAARFELGVSFSIKVGEIASEEIVLSEIGELDDVALMISAEVSMVRLGVACGQESICSLNEQFKLHVKDVLFLWVKACPKQ